MNVITGFEKQFQDFQIDNKDKCFSNESTISEVSSEEENALAGKLNYIKIGGSHRAENV